MNDKPNTPDLVISAAEIDEATKPFVITIRGKRVNLPSLDALNLDQLNAVNAASLRSEFEALNVLLGYASDSSREAVGKLPAKLLMKLFTQWTRDAGVEPGESEPSES